MTYFTTYGSPVGEITLASDGEGLAGLWIENQKYHGGTLYKGAERKDGLAVFVAAKKWLDRYFRGEKPRPAELPLAPAGGEFRQTVWRILCEIPYGKVTTYGAVAEKTAKKLGRGGMSSQAVGGAVGHNPISIIIPCHRVVGAQGSLTGYAGGFETKIKLLEHEGVDMSRLFVPKGRKQ
jgi:methylated-DNA-[protein]-cysteine S-methyltransferase